ncbi:MAG: lipid II flippase MurJ [Verrucomicrobiota bacterium]
MASVSISLFRKLQSMKGSPLLSGVLVGGVMTVAVKCIAFSKELVVASRFGTSDEVDAFLIVGALMIFLSNVLGDSFRDATVPVYAKLKEKGERLAAGLVSNMLWICFATALVVCLFVLVFRYPVTDGLGGGFSEAKKERAGELLFWLFPFAMFYGMATLLKGYVQANGRFGVSSVAAAVVPLLTIVLLLAIPGAPSATYIAVGHSVGAFFLFLIVFWAASRVRGGSILEKPRWDSFTGSAASHVLPLIIGASILEGCVFVDSVMAATLESGSVTVLNYAAKVATIVLSIGGTAAGQVLFPHVAKLVVKEEWERLVKSVLQFSLVVFVCSIPFVIFFWVAAEPVVRILFERGEFTAEDTTRVAEVLQFAGLYIPGFILALLGVRIIMALRAGRILLLTTTFLLLLNIGLNFAFMKQIGVKGIALSTACVSAASAVIHYAYFFRRVAVLRKRAAAGG